MSKGKIVQIIGAVVDVVLVRAAWVVFSIVPGAVIGGVLAYLAAWLLMPEATEETPSSVARRLTRSERSRRSCSASAPPGRP